MRNKVHTQPNSRLILGQEYENDEIEVMAWVSGIKTFVKKGKPTTRILLDRPQIARKHGGNHKARSYDSHTWIDIDDIETAYANVLYLSVGDLVIFTAFVHEYRGQIEHGTTGIKYGFNRINDICSGYPFFGKQDAKGTSGLQDIRYDYPRHNEWILRWEKPFVYETQPIPKYLRDVESYNGWTLPK